jgi:hypothetical protein
MNEKIQSSGKITRRGWLRFLEKIVIGEVCNCGKGESHRHWIWTGAKTRGYGSLTYKQQRYYAHRFAWFALRGEIPQGFEPDHVCKIEACCNPYCIEIVTPRINKLRGNSVAAMNAKKTHCPKGHELLPGNCSPQRLKNGFRVCRICIGIRDKQHRLAHPEMVEAYRERKNKLRKIRRHLAASVLFLLWSVYSPNRAASQWAVAEVTAPTQLLNQAAHYLKQLEQIQNELTQINNQKDQILQLGQQIKNQIQNLQRLPGSITAKGNLDAQQITHQQQALQANIQLQEQMMEAALARSAYEEKAEEVALSKARLQLMQQATAYVDTSKPYDSAGKLPDYEQFYQRR